MGKAAAWAGAVAALLGGGILWSRRGPRTPAAAPADGFFEDASPRAGIAFRHFQGRRSSLLPEDMGSGACWGDADGDGWEDLYLVNARPLDAQKAEPGSNPRNALYRNRGDGTFEDATQRAGAGGRGLGMGCVFADFSNSGRPDLLVTGWEGSILYRNDGGLKFTEITREAGLSDSRWSAGACVGDYDGDARLDLYLPRYVAFDRNYPPRTSAVERGGFSIPVTLSPFAFPSSGNSLYRNLGGRRFQDATRSAGVGAGDRKGMQCLFADLDEDGRPDLYVADDVTPDALFRNAGGGRFADATYEAWLGDVKSSMGAGLGDFDADGDWDLIVTQWIAHEKSLYLNLLRERRGTDAPGKRLHFSDGNTPAGLGETTLDTVGWGTAFLDFDNDGWADILIVNGSTFEDREAPEKLSPQKMQLFRNDGDGTFTEVSSAAGAAFQNPINGRGAAVADYDRDGRLDLAVNANGGPALLLRNAVRNGNHWLQIQLSGRRSNRDAVGAKVTARTPDGRTQSCLVTAGGSYLSMNSRVCHFGLGRWERAEEVFIRWPSGREQSLGAVPADRRLSVIEGRSAAGRAR